MKRIEDHGFAPWQDRSEVVPIVDAELPKDSLDDFIRDIHKEGGSVQPLLNAEIAHQSSIEAAKLLCRALTMILEARRPRMFIEQLMFAAGMTAQSGTSLAAEYHVSKQNFQQGSKRILASLGMRKTRTMRDLKARLKMRKRNNRNHKLK